MAPAAARAVIQPSRLILRRAPIRNASSASDAAASTAQKAKDGASQATSKASEGLSKVQSAASSSVGKASEAASNVANKATGRVAGMIRFVQSLVPPTIYYSKVGWEMSKIIFQGQKMQPPSMANIQTYYTRFLQSVRNPRSLISQNPGLLNPQQVLQRVQGISRAQMVTAGIVGAELIGFFTVGEMLGKMKIVGYRGKVEHA